MSTLKVNTIQNTSGTQRIDENGKATLTSIESAPGKTALTFDPEGRVRNSVNPSFQGRLSGVTVATANYYPTYELIQQNTGMTLSSNNRLTVPVAGRYLVMAHQLTRTGSVAAYLNILHNGNSVVHTYCQANETHYDMNCQCILNMAAGDYIEFYYSGTVAYSWAGPHSSVSVAYLG